MVPDNRPKGTDSQVLGVAPAGRGLGRLPSGSSLGPVPVRFYFNSIERTGTLLSSDGNHAIVRDSSGWKMVVDARSLLRVNG